jgi:hypothetical protein
LATQAVTEMQTHLDNAKELSETVFQFKSAIAEKIYIQMKEHFVLNTPITSPKCASICQD